MEIREQQHGAVKAIAPGCDTFFVVGAPTSSNASRLVEVARKAGCPRATLIETADAIDWDSIPEGTLGLTAGASTPDLLVREVIAAAQIRYAVTVEETSITPENMSVGLPRLLSA